MIQARCMSSIKRHTFLDYITNPQTFLIISNQTKPNQTITVKNYFFKFYMHTLHNCICCNLFSMSKIFKFFFYFFHFVCIFVFVNLCLFFFLFFKIYIAFAHKPTKKIQKKNKKKTKNKKTAEIKDCTFTTPHLNI